MIHARLLHRTNCLSAVSKSWVQTEEVGFISSSGFLEALSQQEFKNSVSLSAPPNPLLIFSWSISSEELNLPILWRNPLTTSSAWSEERSLSTADKGTTQEESLGTKNAYSHKQAHPVASSERGVHLDPWARREHWTFMLINDTRTVRTEVKQQGSVFVA